MLVDLISYVLGYRGIEYVDDTIMAMLSIFSPGMPPAVHYDYATYIAEKIHEQLMNFPRERVFRFTSYIYHLLLFLLHMLFFVFAGCLLRFHGRLLMCC